VRSGFCGRSQSLYLTGILSPALEGRFEARMPASLDRVHVLDSHAIRAVPSPEDPTPSSWRPRCLEGCRDPALPIPVCYPWTVFERSTLLRAPVLHQVLGLETIPIGS
jgi:hypothetical protein